MSAPSYVTHGALTLAGLLLCGDVLAQEITGLEGVTVRAQKRTADLQDVPMSVTVVTADELADGGLNDLAGVATRVPSLDLQQSVTATTTSLRIRRVGSIGNIPTFEPAVGLFIDGAYRPRSLLGSSDFVDAERIELLRGPQSTLYGKNSTAGVVALYTALPAERFEGSAEATFGYFDSPGSPLLRNLKLRLSGPLTASVGATAAAVYSQHGYTMANALPNGPRANDDDRVALRGQLAWSPHASVDLRLLVGYAQENDNQGDSDVFLAPGSPAATVAGVLRDAGLAEACGDNEPRNRTTCSVAASTFDFDAVDATLLGTFRLPNGWTLTSITGWDRYDAVRGDGDVGQLSAPILRFDDVESGDSFQEELRLSSEGEQVSWLAGLYYYRHVYKRGDGDVPMFTPTGTAAFHPIWATLLRGLPLALPGQDGIHESRLDTRYLSVFGHTVWNATERLSLTTGVRWQREEKAAAINNSLTVPGASLISTSLTPSVSPSGEPVNGAIERRTDNVTWSIAPQYRFNPAFMAYVEVSRGAKSGGFNTGFGNASLAAREFGDERVDHYELGARATLAGGRASVSAATFYTEYRDYQDAAFVSAQFSVGNADRVELKGAELDATWLVARGWLADLSISAADLSYAVNTTGACFPGRVPDGTAPRSCNLAGERPINAPVWSTHVGLQHDRDVRWGSIYARVDWSWTDEYNTSFSADPRLVQDDHGNVALRIGARLGAYYEVVLWADNLLDAQVTTIDAVLNLFNDTSYQSFQESSRRFGATLRMRF